MSPPVFAPQALFFDLDGTLIDGRSDVQAAVHEVLDACGRPLNDEDHCMTVGRSWEDMHALLSERVPVPISVEEMAYKISSVRLKNIRSQGPTMLPGAVEVVQKLSQSWPTVLVTGSSRPEAESIIDTLGLHPHFQFLICAGDAVLAKPAPHPYLLAANRLGIAPSRGLAVEDSAVGIDSACSAGLFCVAVRAGNVYGQDQTKAHHIVDTLHELASWLQPECSS